MHRARRNNRRSTGERTGTGTRLTGRFPDNTGEIQGIYRDCTPAVRHETRAGCVGHRWLTVAPCAAGQGLKQKTRRLFPAAQVGLPDLRIKKPISGRPEIGAQFQLWIFSYTIRPRSSKKSLSRLMIACAAA